MQIFGPQVCVSLQVNPVFMPRNQGHLLHLVAQLEQSTGALMAQVVEVQIQDAQRVTRALEILA